MSYAKYFTILILILYTSTVRADTILHNKSFFNSETLTLKKSPYIIQGNITVHPGATLTVESGVKFMFDQGGIFVRQGGYLKLVGESDSIIELQVTSPGISSLIYGDRADISLKYVHIYSTQQPLFEVWNHTNLYMDHVVADAYSDDSVNRKYFISAFDHTTITVHNSELSNWQGTVFQIFSDAQATITDSFFKNNRQVFEIYNAYSNIHNNDFEDNIMNVERFPDTGQSYYVDAKENWWGSVIGPGATVNGDVLFTPWSAKPNIKKDHICCSNVLFLPGLMGSRLYRGGVFENQLWEPNRNADVKKLFLNEKGESVDPTIYTRDIIGQTNIVGGVGGVEQNIYLDFIKTLQTLVQNKKIHRFVSSPYDWRYAPDTILEDGIIQGSKNVKTSIDLIDVVKKLAFDSKTKKISIITHSNGGLVAKQLLIELKRLKLEHMVDKVIFVAMPEFGTPQAITSLLFGHDQSIAHGLILKSSIAKELGRNMPTAYTLLPSEKYLQHAHNSLNFAGNAISNTHALHQQLQKFSQTNRELLSRAQSLHQTLDNWIPPSNMEVFQILGTGIPTVSGLLSLESKKDTQKFLPEYTTSGDGIVQTNHGRTGNVTIFDMQNTKYKHVNIMNAPVVMIKIKDILQSSENTDASISTPDASISSSYKMVTFSPIFDFLPTGFTLTTAYQTDPNPSAASKFKYDTYITGYSNYFDSVTENSNMNRFELFGNDVNYLYMNNAETVTLSDGGGAAVDIRLLDKQRDSLTELSFPTVVSSKGSDISIDKNQYMTITVPLVDQVITIQPIKKTVFDTTGQVVEERELVNTTETIEDRIARIKQSIITSNITPYIKTRYIRMLDIYLKNKDKTYAERITSRITRAVNSINIFSRNPYLWGRYKKLHQDYVYLKYLLVNI